jgi:catalase
MTDRTPSMTHATGMPGIDNTNIQTAAPRDPALLQDIRLIQRMAHSAVGSALCCPIKGTSRREP